MSVMETQPSASLTALYLDDEIAWLEIMARLAAERRFEEMDHENLSEFLASAADRDRREVNSRMTRLLTLWITWDRWPKKRAKSSRRAILKERLQLRLLLEGAALRSYAEDSLDEAYQWVRELLAVGTGSTPSDFPDRSPMSIDDLLSRKLDVETS